MFRSVVLLSLLTASTQAMASGPCDQPYAPLIAIGLVHSDGDRFVAEHIEVLRGVPEDSMTIVLPASDVWGQPVAVPRLGPGWYFLQGSETEGGTMMVNACLPPKELEPGRLSLLMDITASTEPAVDWDLMTRLWHSSRLLARLGTLDEIAKDGDKLEAADAILQGMENPLRRIQLWDVAVAAHSSTDNLEGLARAYSDAGVWQQAQYVADLAVGAGSTEMDGIVALSAYKLGQPHDLHAIDMRDYLAHYKDIGGLDLSDTEWNTIRTSLKGGDAILDDVEIVDSTVVGYGLPSLSAKGIVVNRSLIHLEAPGADLTGALVTNSALDLSSGMQLNDAYIENVLIIGNGAGADLSGSTLDHVNLFSNLYQERLDLSGADLSDSRLIDSVFASIDLSGADLTGAVFDNVRWVDVLYDCATIFPDGIEPDLLGMTSWDECPGKDVSFQFAYGCEQECLAWLARSPRRSVMVIYPDSHQTLLYELEAMLFDRTHPYLGTYTPSVPLVAVAPEAWPVSPKETLRIGRGADCPEPIVVPARPSLPGVVLGTEYPAVRMSLTGETPLEEGTCLLTTPVDIAGYAYRAFDTIWQEGDTGWASIETDRARMTHALSWSNYKDQDAAIETFVAFHRFWQGAHPLRDAILEVADQGWATNTNLKSLKFENVVSGKHRATPDLVEDVLEDPEDLAAFVDLLSKNAPVGPVSSLLQGRQGYPAVQFLDQVVLAMKALEANGPDAAALSKANAFKDSLCTHVAILAPLVEKFKTHWDECLRRQFLDPLIAAATPQPQIINFGGAMTCDPPNGQWIMDDVDQWISECRASCEQFLDNATIKWCRASISVQPAIPEVPSNAALMTPVPGKPGYYTLDE